MNPERHTALTSLTAQYTDSEGEPDSDVEMEERNKDSQNSVESSSSSSDERVSFFFVDEKSSSKGPSKLVSYASEQHDRGSDSEGSPVPNHFANEDFDESSLGNSALQNPPLSPISFNRSLQGLKRQDVKCPPEPAGRCSKSLQDKILELYEKKTQGMDMNASIQQKKNFRNPSIYEKLVEYCELDEKGTNYPPEIYDPHCWGKESFYDELAKRQKEEMDRREKEKKERTKVEFMSGTAKKPTAEIPPDIMKRKSKWDVGITQISSALKPATLVTPTVLPVATGTKPTVISAFGTITKKLKQ